MQGSFMVRKYMYRNDMKMMIILHFSYIKYALQHLWVPSTSHHRKTPKK